MGKLLTFKVPVKEANSGSKSWHHHHGLIQMLLLGLGKVAPHLQCVQVVPRSSDFDKPVKKKQPIRREEEEEKKEGNKSKKWEEKWDNGMKKIG